MCGEPSGHAPLLFSCPGQVAMTNPVSSGSLAPSLRSRFTARGKHAFSLKVVSQIVRVKRKKMIKKNITRRCRGIQSRFKGTESDTEDPKDKHR